MMMIARNATTRTAAEDDFAEWNAWHNGTAAAHGIVLSRVRSSG
jgi:hypothetical protein